MLPKTKLYPFFLLSLFALVLYSYYQPSLPISTLQDSDLRLNFVPQLAHERASSQNFTFIIKLLAYDRINSISRCLRSLANADYGGDRVELHVYIDHFREFDPSNESRILEEKIEQSHKILEFVDGFSWKYGNKMVHYRTRNVGLQAQWLEAWWPSSDDEFVFIVEDDLEVSPLYYRFLRSLILNYYYEPSNYSPSIYGASLQRPRFVAGKHGNKLLLDSGTRLFLYQMVGTWGQLLFPKPWKEFRVWYDIHKAKSIKPILQGMVTTGWYKKMGERIWTPWFIKFIYSRGYYNIYTNFLHERALSVSHRDAGVNYGKTAGPDSQLLEERSLGFDLWKKQSLGDLKWYDFCFKEMIPNRVVKRFAELRSVLNSVQKEQTVIYVSIYRTSTEVVRNLLCHFERMNIQNYVLLGTNPDYLLDLARRGHPVIDVEHLITDIMFHKLTGIQGLKTKLIKELFVKAFLIKSSLDFGFNSWIIDGNFVPVKDPFIGPLSSFVTATDMEFLFVKGLDATKRIWIDDFIHKVASTAETVIGKETHQGIKHFGVILSKFLEEKGVAINRVDVTSFGVNMAENYVNQSSFVGERKLVFWHHDQDLNLLNQKLEDAGLWAVDGELSCKAVICHAS